jgi:hypothetical protein
VFDTNTCTRPLSVHMARELGHAIDTGATYYGSVSLAKWLDVLHGDALVEQAERFPRA